MKKVRITLIILAMAISHFIPSFAKMKAPDFAYPQTVEKNASADLETATKSGDAHAAINALIRMYIAQSLIDPDSISASIAKAENTARAFADSQLHGIFDALIAKMYSQAYNRRSWVYNSRETPMLPLPADITEWNGRQFRQRIDSLASASYSNPQALSSLKITDYKDIITADGLTAIYYPTLLDFAYQNAIDLTNYDGDSSAKKIFAIAEKNAASDPAKILWAYKTFQHDSDNKDLFLKYYREFGHSDHFGLILDAYASTLFYPSDAIEEPVDATEEDDAKERASKIDAIRECIGMIDTFAKGHPTSPFANNLANERARLTQQRVDAKSPSYCSPGKSFAVEILSQNAASATLKVYRITDPEVLNGDNYYTKISRLAPSQTIAVKFDEAVPFLASKEVEISIKEPGYYVVMASTPNGDTRGGFEVTRCLAAYPFVAQSANEGYVEVTDPATGAPMKGVEVILKKSSYRSPKPAPMSLGLTDSKGVARFKCTDNGSYQLALKVKGTTYNFGDMSLWIHSPEKWQGERLSANILTDRSIYHPGDTINAIAIVGRTSTDANGASQATTAEGIKAEISLYDANRQLIDSVAGTTDRYGRISFRFVAPTEGLTGAFSIQASAIDSGKETIIGSAQVMVSDYRMPDFELSLDKPARDVPSKGDVTISGSAVTYSGAPLANAEVTARVKGVSFWRWYSGNTAPFFAHTATTDASGRFSITVPDSVLAANATTGFYEMEVDAMSPSGTAAYASTTFTQGLRYEISIAPLKNINVDGEKPFTPAVTVIGPDGEKADIALMWQLKRKGKIVESGDFHGSIDLANAAPDTYQLSILPADTALAAPQAIDICIYNVKSGKAPASTPLWVLANEINASSHEATIEYATAFPEAYVYYTFCGSRFTPVDYHKVKAGYHKLTISVPQGIAPAYVLMFVVSDCKAYVQQIRLTNQKDTKLRIEAEAFRDRLTPGQKETWTLHIKNPDGSAAESAVVLDMFNKALSAIQPHSLAFYASMPEHFRPLSHRSLGNGFIYNSISVPLTRLQGKYLSEPQFNFYGQSGMGWNGGVRMYKARLAASNVKDEMYDGEMVLEESMVTNDLAMAAPGSAMTAGGDMTEAEAEEIAEDLGGAPAEKRDDTFRSDDVPLAIWAPMLSTDRDGNLCYTFMVPNANTTWQLQALAWTAEMHHGSLVRDFVASKPIMAMPNAPRFLRVGDRGEISTLIINNTDSAATASVTAEIFNPLTGQTISTYDYAIDLAPNSSRAVATPIEAAEGMAAIGFRIKASDGAFSDGEQSAIRILPSLASVIETEPFYLNPGETEYTAKLPAQKGARISLTFCENPIWTVVSALPGLRESAGSTANSAAAAIFSACVARGLVADNPAIGDAIEKWLSTPSDSALTSMLEKNEDLKAALLNATPWVQNAQSESERMQRLSLIFGKKENEAAISEAMATLKKLQNADGGWAWGSWDAKSSEWTTSNVLAMMADLKRHGWLPADNELNSMIGRAVKYYDDCQAKALALAHDKNKVTDLAYALVRPHFQKIALTLDGKKVIANTINHISSNWKSYSDPAYKAMAAEAMYFNNYPAKSKEIMASVAQFGVWSKSQGLKFPSVNALYDYAILLEAFATITPGSREVDGLRQQLIIRKEGADWGSAVVTNEVVAAVLSSGTKWTVPAKGAVVTAGGVAIKAASPMESATGSIRADLSEYAGKTLEIATSGTGPAYGAVFAQYKQMMNEVKASACDDLSIEKEVTIRRGNEWLHSYDSLQAGDRVQVQLTIHCKRNLQYVTIVDERPAAFQPVQQVPGWVYSEGVGFYRENRDAATNLYVSYMRPGTYILQYDMTVGMSGVFFSGVATIQSQYAPEISAHSAGSTITVK